MVNIGRGYPDNSTGLILVDLIVSVQRWICHEDQRATCWHDPFPQPWEGLGRVFTWPCVLYKICKSRYFNCSLSCCCLFLLWLLPSHFLCPVELEWHWQFGDLVKGKLLRRYTEYELSVIHFVVSMPTQQRALHEGPVIVSRYEHVPWCRQQTHAGIKLGEKKGEARLGMCGTRSKSLVNSWIFKNYMMYWICKKIERGELCSHQ